jgi:hypothetical protein
MLLYDTPQTNTNCVSLGRNATSATPPITRSIPIVMNDVV